MMKRKERSKEKETNLKNVHNIRVRFNETDPLGIVWHGYYIDYFEEGREAFGREHGISYLDVKTQGFVTPIIKSTCEHKLPLKYGDVAKIETTYVNTPAAKMIFKYKIFNPENQVVAIGETVQVFVDDKGELSLNIPGFINEWKQKVGLD